VDRVIVLHHGKLAETGTHEELLDKKGIYYRLYRLQFTRE
jgi:ABC-type multidrug transport system fused ATPase/permease subunit